MGLSKHKPKNSTQQFSLSFRSVWNLERDFIAVQKLVKDKDSVLQGNWITSSLLNGFVPNSANLTVFDIAFFRSAAETNPSPSRTHGP